MVNDSCNITAEQSGASGSHGDSKDSIHSHCDHREIETGECMMLCSSCAFYFILIKYFVEIARFKFQRHDLNFECLLLKV